MPEVSVIIPVYNVEKYLKDCLNSVIGQTLVDIEIICVNDGSSDNSGAILAEYAEKDSRIKIINQNNLGAGAARNAGLRAASGKYLSFIDSDDFLDLRMYEVLFKKIESLGCDIAICDYHIVDEANSIIYDNILREEYSIFQRYGAFNYKTCSVEILNKFQNVAWNKIFRTEFVKEQGLLFQEINRANDLFFVRSLMLSTEKICCTAEQLVYYRPLSTGLQSNYYKNPYDIIKALSALKKFMVQKGLYERFYDEIRYYFTDSINYTLLQIKNNFFVYIKFMHYLKKCGLKELELKKSDVMINSLWHILLRKIFCKIKNKINDIFMISPEQERKTPCVTVIICNYNGEEYLEKCLRSVVFQTLKNIEIICVNDGSTDNSLKILEEYAELDSRIKIINQTNRGLATSRNNALKSAKGEYIAFVDVDDWLRIDALAELFSRAKNDKLDMLSFSSVNIKKETMAKIDFPYHDFTYLPKAFNLRWFNYKKFRKYLLSMAVSSCLTIYNRDFIKLNNIRFPDGICFEDNVFFTKSIFLAKRCGILREKFYYRLSHSGQITSNKTKYFGDYIAMVKKMKELMDELDIAKSIKTEYIVKYTNYAYSYFKKLTREEQLTFNEQINEILKFDDEVLEDKYYDFKDKVFSIRRTNFSKQIRILGLKYSRKKTIY